MLKEELIKKWLNDSLSDDEKRQFEADNDHHDLVRLSDTLKVFGAPDYDVDVELIQLLANKPSYKKSKQIAFFRPVMLLRVAAALIIGIGAYFFLTRDNKIRIETLAGIKKELLLPDSSVVVLNARSVLEYNESRWPEERIVELTGEAYFKVVKGSDFKVLTTSGVVQVLGTQFNVKDRTKYYEVTCFEGKVRVLHAEKQVELVPDQVLRVINGHRSQMNIGAFTSPSWITDESAFESVPYSHVLEEFERQYGVAVTLISVDTSQLFTGSFAHGDLTLALMSISMPFSLTYTIKDNTNIILSGDTK